MFKHSLPQKDRSKFWMKIAKPVALSTALTLTFGSAISDAATLATLQALPLFQMSDMTYIGGFKFPTNTLGISDITYSEGPIALGANGASLYAVGHTYQQAIGEFKIPALTNSQNVADFKTATAVQNFSKVLDRPASGNPQGMDRIGGMAYINGQLLVNTYIYYDASNSGTNTTLVVKDAANLASSGVAGYFSYSARAHATGWISPIPQDWQSQLGGTWITGDSSGKAIISRLSVGPSAFVFDPTSPQLGNLSPSTISLAKYSDFDLDHPMGANGESATSYLNNATGKNDMWTHMSKAMYGFIVPGTRTYMAVGYNGGMTSGVGYKVTQSDGTACAGYCANNASDYSNYYWLFDMNDMLKIRAGTMSSYNLKPYAYGKLAKTYPTNGNGFNAIIGATFDPAKNVLYMSLQGGDRLAFGWAPSVVAFQLKTSAAPAPVTSSPPAAPSTFKVTPQ